MLFRGDRVRGAYLQFPGFGRGFLASLEGVCGSGGRGYGYERVGQFRQFRQVQTNGQEQAGQADRNKQTERQMSVAGVRTACGDSWVVD